MYIFDSIPFIDDDSYRMKPKKLVEGCKDILLNLKHRIMSHYELGKDNKNRSEWMKWFDRHLPENEDVEDYITYQKYKCPLISYFKQNNFNCPVWTPDEPVTSFSIFPPNVVVALPSVQCRYDYHGTAKPYMVIRTGNERDINGSNSLLMRSEKYSKHYIK